MKGQDRKSQSLKPLKKDKKTLIDKLKSFLKMEEISEKDLTQIPDYDEYINKNTNFKSENSKTHDSNNGSEIKTDTDFNNYNNQESNNLNLDNDFELDNKYKNKTNNSYYHDKNSENEYNLNQKYEKSQSDRQTDDEFENYNHPDFVLTNSNMTLKNKNSDNNLIPNNNKKEEKLDEDKFNLKDRIRLDNDNNSLNNEDKSTNINSSDLNKSYKKRKIPLLNMFKAKHKEENNLIRLNDNEKAKIGLIIFFMLIILTVSGVYYFAVYEPQQNELNKYKLNKINELNSLYKGPLVNAKEAYVLEDQISRSESIVDIESVDILRPATAQWKDYHFKKINENKDMGNRVMVSYINNSNKNSILSVNESETIVLDNDAKVLSNIDFKKPDTVAVPIKVSRLQACSGLIYTKSKIDIYCINLTDENLDKENIQTDTDSVIKDNYNKNPEISGCTVLAIMRGKDSGIIDSKTSDSYTSFTNSRNKSEEYSNLYSTDIEENLKASSIGEYDDYETYDALNSYGITLSDYERQANIGELDSEYLILLEVPRENVRFVLNNMENLILTIPTDESPYWMINEIKEANNNI